MLDISKDPGKTLIFSLTALILYIPANLIPFMTFEMYGNRTETTIWSGIMSLYEGGDGFLALIVFIASMLVPFIKILGLLYLSVSAQESSHREFKLKLFKTVEIIGPWSMLDVFLLAIFVAVLKLDSMASVEAGLGSYLFLLVVIFTMYASASFNVGTICPAEKNKHD